MEMLVENRLHGQPSLNKLKILELANGQWIEQRTNCFLVDNSGAGKTFLDIACLLARRRVLT